MSDTRDHIERSTLNQSQIEPLGGGGGGYATRGVAGTFLQLGTVFQIVLSVLLSFGVQMYFDSFVRFA